MPTLNRRDFLKLCAVMGAGTVAILYSFDIKRVISEAAAQNGGKVHLVWLLLGGDTGCTVSMFQASNPDLVEAVQSLSISADYWQTVMTPDYDLGWVAAGYTTEDRSQAPLMAAAFGNAPVDVLVVEGTPQTAAPPGGGQGAYCTIGEYGGAPVTGYELLQKLAAKAGTVVAVGSCSAFGGIPAGAGGGTGAVPVTEALRMAGVQTKSPVINLPGCPIQPDWTLITLATVLQGFSADLDDLGRPKAFFTEYIHDRCPRRPAYDRGEYAAAFDDPVGCYWKLGCKGPITQSSCAVTKWNGGTGFCTQAGPMCWGCMHPSFPETPTSSFFAPVEQTPKLLGLGLTADEVGGAVVGGVAAILAVHGARRAVGKGEEKDAEPAAAKEGGAP
jgi:hydrogenase small subunit